MDLKNFDFKAIIEMIIEFIKTIFRFEVGDIFGEETEEAPEA